MKTTYRPLYVQLNVELKKMVDYYQMKSVGIPPRIVEKAKTILKSESLEQARDIYQRTVRSMELEALGLWGKGKIQGPLTPNNLESQARKAESLYRLHKKKGNDRVALQQQEKAEKLRAQAQGLRTSNSSLKEG